MPTAASWSRLSPAPGKENGDSFLIAHAGIGDTFPVQDEEGYILLAIVVAAGNDDHLLVEVRSKEASQMIDLRRDKHTPVQIAGIDYELYYPSVSVNAAENEKRTTSKATLIVTRRP